MEKFLSDLNEILSIGLGIEVSNTVLLIVSAILGLTIFTALFLATSSIAKILSSKPIPKAQELPPPTEEEHKVAIEVGEFGKIVSDTKALIKGIELDYFIIKKSKYEKDTLPIGTIVVVIKRNAKEAYVKPADPKDIKRLKGVL